MKLIEAFQEPTEGPINNQADRVGNDLYDRLSIIVPQLMSYKIRHVKHASSQAETLIAFGRHFYILAWNAAVCMTHDSSDQALHNKVNTLWHNRDRNADTKIRDPLNFKEYEKFVSVAERFFAPLSLDISQSDIATPDGADDIHTTRAKCIMESLDHIAAIKAEMPVIKQLYKDLGP